MIVDKSDTYVIVDSKDKNIIFGNNSDSKFFDINTSSFERTISIWKDNSIDYNIVLYKNCDFKIKIEQKKITKRTNINLFVLANNDIIKWTIDTNIWVSNIDTEINICSLIWENWNIQIDGNIFIAKNLQWIKWRLFQESIYLSDSWKCLLAPKLEILSNDVVVSHWARVEKLNNEKMFYLESKWLDRHEAKKLMVSWYINKYVSWMKNEDFEKELYDYILSK